MKKFEKVIWVIFLLLFFCGSTPSLQSPALAEDFSSPGSQWQAIPAYGPELAILADWQDTTSTDNTTDFGALLGTPTDSDSTTNDMDNMSGATLTGNSATGGMGNMPSGLMGSSGMGGLLSSLGGLTGGTSSMGNMLGGLMGSNATGGWSNLSSELIGDNGNISNSPMLPMVTDYLTKDLGLGGTIIDDPCQLEPGTATVKLKNWTVLGGTVTYALTPEEATRWYTTFNSVGGWSDKPILKGTELTADFDPSKPGLETKYNMISPLVIDTDKNGVIELSGGTIQFDIAPHIAGLETIPVPAPGKDMFLVWDKTGTETTEGAEREYKEGEIIDITELFGPTDYTRSDFSVLAYTDDGFTKLRKLCDIDNDGDVDKQDTALSAEVAAKLKLWSPLSGQLILFKDTDIVVDVRAGSYERHPSDVEGWAVEYKMKDNQDRLVGYQWLTSKTSSLLCVDVLLAIQ